MKKLVIGVLVGLFAFVAVLLTYTLITKRDFSRSELGAILTTQVPTKRLIKVVAPPTVAPSLNCNQNSKTSTSVDGKYNIYSSTICKYSFSYPKNWNLSDYTGGNSIAVGDLLNPASADPESFPGHSMLNITIFSGVASSAFPYTNGPTGNDTIKKYSINGYQGIRGKQESQFGIQDVVYLQGSNGSWVALVWSGSSTPIFNLILSTFKFTK